MDYARSLVELKAMHFEARATGVLLGAFWEGVFLSLLEASVPRHGNTLETFTRCVRVTVWLRTRLEKTYVWDRESPIQWALAEELRADKEKFDREVAGFWGTV